MVENVSVDFNTNQLDQRRVYSGIVGEKNAKFFIEDAGLKIIKINSFEPTVYSGQHDVDIIASEWKLGSQGFYTQYHIFEVTNFKRSTHMNYGIMTEKIDNILEAKRDYPNAILWLVTSYNNFDKRISARIHRLCITVLTMGRQHKVWHGSLKRCYSHDMTFQYHRYELRELRMILKGVLTKEEAYIKDKVKDIKERLGKHYPRKQNIIETYIDRNFTQPTLTKRLLNKVYKLQTALHKLGIETEKIGTLLKSGLALFVIIYRLQNKLKEALTRKANKELPTITNKILLHTNDKTTKGITTERQRKYDKSVCVKASYSKLQVVFENRLCVGVFDGNTGITWGVNDFKMPKYITELLG